MGRWRDEETRRNRTRNYPSRDYDQRGHGQRGYDGDQYREEDYYRRYDEPYDDRYYREREREREFYWREREQRQETRRTGMMVVGAICVAVIALIGVMAVTGGEDPSQTAQQPPQQQAPQQAAPAAGEQVPQQQQQSPAAPGQDGASSEQIEGMRADLQRQLAGIRQSINELRLEIWGFFAGQQSGQQEPERQ